MTRAVPPDHPLMHPDPDVGCAWLCRTAGIRSVGDEQILAEVLDTLPFQRRPLTIHPGLIPANLWSRA